MDLRKYSDQELFKSTQSYVKKEQEITIIVLKHLREIERRRSFADWGYSSLFSYCTDHLGYTKAEAYARICAMRLLKGSPMAQEKMEKGRLGLSNAMELYGKLQKEEHKTGQKVSEEKKQELLEKLDGLSTREAQKLLDMEFSHQGPSVKRKNLSLEEETFKNLERLKLKLGLKTEEELINLLLQEKEKSLEMKGEKKTKEKEKEKENLPSKRQTRHIPRKTREEVRKKADFQCEIVSPLTGKRCEARHNLQIDHIYPYAWGGSHAIENLRLICQAHNLRNAVKSLGQEKMDFYINKSEHCPSGQVGRPNQIEKIEKEGGVGIHY